MGDPLALCAAWCGQPRHPHRNSLYCLACRAARRKRPLSRITNDQGAHIRRLANTGEMTRAQIAAQVGVSTAQITRWLREQPPLPNARDYSQEVYEAVSRVYEAAPPGEGMAAAQEAFPDVVIRSVIERRAHHRGTFVARQVRWTGAQLIEAARMAGVVCKPAQAVFFGRPNAADGSITSLWAKHFGCAPRDINGIGAHLAYRIARPGVPAVVVAPDNTTPTPKIKVLWLDLLPHLRDDVEPAIREAVEALALFQRWLHGADSAATITTMIQEREATHGHQNPRPQERPDGDHPRGTPDDGAREQHRRHPEYAGRGADVAPPDEGGDEERGDT